MNEQQLRDYLLEFDGTIEDRNTDEKLSLFRVGESGTIFAGLEKSADPARISLRCDRLLAKNLRQKYETVLGASKFDPKTWNTVIVTGQLSDDEVRDLIRLSYNLTTEL